MRLVTWLLSKDPVVPSVGAGLYWGLFVLSMGGGAIPAFLELVKDDRLGAGSIFAIAFGVTTLAQQTLVYRDMHAIDEGHETDYGDWPGTRLEWILRLFLFIFLLLGVGKVASAFLPLVEYVQRPVVKNWLIDMIGHDKRSHYFFVSGSIGVYAILIPWNLFAAHFQFRSVANGTTDQKAHLVLVLIRLGAFVMLSMLCLGFWSCILFDLTLTTHWSELWIVVYIVLVGGVLALRNRAIQDRCEGLVRRFAKWGS